ncbi:MAG TPA: response regulator, partial [Bacteroidales bacterium]|nr:response regulator [Bacteroidales bacterium]
MEQSLNILIVEDNPGDIVIIKELIRSSGISFISAHASTLKETMILCEKNEYDIILLDLGLPDSLGLNTLKQLHAKYDRAPLVVMTGLDDEDTALEALREGAQDYLVKNRLTADGIIRTIKYSIERKKINDLHKQYAQRFSILSAATAALNECEDIPSIFRIICANLRILLDNAGVFAIEFPDNEKVRFLGIEWLKPWYDKIYRITGVNLNSPVFSINQNIGKLHEIFVNKKLRRIEGGLYKAFAGMLEKKSCLDVERLLNINFIYSIGFHQHHIFYGGFMVFSKNPIGNDDRNVIETI